MTDDYADEYSGWDTLFPPDRRAREYEGLTRGEAESLARESAVTAVRVADRDRSADTVFTADFRPRRLNLLIHHGRVVRAGYG